MSTITGDDIILSSVVNVSIISPSEPFRMYNIVSSEPITISVVLSLSMSYIAGVDMILSSVSCDHSRAPVSALRAYML